MKWQQLEHAHAAECGLIGCLTLELSRAAKRRRLE